MYFGKKAVIVTAAGMLAASAVTGCSGSVDTDAVVATVGEDEITYGVANFYARMTQGEYETYYAAMMGTTGEDMWSMDAGDGKTYEDSVKESLLEALENMYILSQHASEYDVSLSEDEMEQIEDAAKQFDENNSDEVKETVSGYRKDIEKYLELMTIRYKMEDKMKEGVDEEVSDEEAAQKGMDYVFFSFTVTDDSGTSSELSDEEKETLRENAQSLIDRVRAGEDMTAVAEEYGVQVQSSTFDSENVTPNEELIAAADALENEGDVTDVVESDSGIYVAKLTSLLDREATDQEKASIVEERKQEQYDSLLEEWKDATEITVNDKIWEKIDFAETGVTILTTEDETESEASE